MKTLSVKQPWASLIVHGYKDIENRKWKTSYRGRILIHASAKPVFGCWDALSREQQLCLIQQLGSTEFGILPFGAIIGSVIIVDCVHENTSVWAEKDVYNWILKDPKLFKNPTLS